MRDRPTSGGLGGSVLRPPAPLLSRMPPVMGAGSGPGYALPYPQCRAALTVAGDLFGYVWVEEPRLRSRTAIPPSARAGVAGQLVAGSLPQ